LQTKKIREIFYAQEIVVHKWKIIEISTTHLTAVHMRQMFSVKCGNITLKSAPARANCIIEF